MLIMSWTIVPSRLLVLKYGADLVWSPETVDQAIIGCEHVIDGKYHTVINSLNITETRGFEYIEACISKQCA